VSGATEKDNNQRVMAMLSGHVVTQLVASAVRFRIPDHLGDRTMTDTDLARLTGIGLGELRRFLRALEGLGLVASAGPGEYRSTPLANSLRRDAGGLYGQALMAGSEYYDAWSELDHSLRTGESAFERRHGRSLWALFDDDGDVAEWFARTMRWNSERALEQIFELYDFPQTGVVVDVGAGDGTLLCALLNRLPQLRGIAFEQPAVIGHTRRTVHEHGLADRCELVAGDFLAGVPEGGNLYLLKSVVHNWNDSLALRVLGNCRAAVGEHGRLLLIEHAMGGDDELGAAVRDLTMLVLFGGQDRSPHEYRSLLERAGFTVDRVMDRAAGGQSRVCLLAARAA
jgi:orsellinic acid C2-O-methyltransferase